MKEHEQCSKREKEYQQDEIQLRREIESLQIVVDHETARALDQQIRIEELESETAKLSAEVKVLSEKVDLLTKEKTRLEINTNIKKVALF